MNGNVPLATAIKSPTPVADKNLVALKPTNTPTEPHKAKMETPTYTVVLLQMPLVTCSYHLTARHGVQLFADSNVQLHVARDLAKREMGQRYQWPCAAFGVNSDTVIAVLAVSAHRPDSYHNSCVRDATFISSGGQSKMLKLPDEETKMDV